MTDKEMIHRFLDKNYQVLFFGDSKQGYVVFDKINRKKETPDSFFAIANSIFNYRAKDVDPFDIIFEWYSERLGESVSKFLKKQKK